MVKVIFNKLSITITITYRKEKKIKKPNSNYGNPSHNQHNNKLTEKE
jgi:hypothetical protein